MLHRDRSLSHQLPLLSLSFTTGRGGAINSHIGNKTFREWVRVRKEEYNLAPSKAEKAKVAREVMDLVKSLDPPGRFLMQDPNCSTHQCWWIEVDETKALAKTCQALREGAPRIRAAHKDELDERAAKKPNKRRKSGANQPQPTTSFDDNSMSNISPFKHSSITTNIAPIVRYAEPTHSTNAISMYPERTPEIVDYATIVDPAFINEGEKTLVRPASTHIVAPLMSNREFEETYGRPAKRVRMEDDQENEPPFSATAETPPLVAQPSPRIQVPPIMRTSSRNALFRTNSLALSEISVGDFSGWDGEFVNPFENESDILWMGDSSTSSADPSSPAPWNAFNTNGGNGFISCQ